MTKRVTFIGLGLMGTGMITTLVKRGYTVKAYDTSAQALERAEDIGAAPVESVREATVDSDQILLSLPGPAQVRSVIQELLRVKDATDTSNMVMIDFSTIDAGTAKDMASLAGAKGARYLEAPVSGAPQGAHSGTLSIMVGGDQDTFVSVKPLLEDLGENIFYLGEAGAASTVKLCNNVVVATTTAILGEAFALTAAEGNASPEQLASVLSTSVGNSKTLEVFGKHMVADDYLEPTFSLSNMHKDLGLFMETVGQNGVSSLLGGLTHQLYAAASNRGWSEEDQSVVCRLLEGMNREQTREEVTE